MPGTWDAIARDDDGNGTISTNDSGDAIMAQGRYMCLLFKDVQVNIARGRLEGDPLNLTLASYNAGPGAVLAAGGIPHNGETESYAPAILATARTYAVSPPPSELGSAILAAGKPSMGTRYLFGGGDLSGPTAAFSGPGVGFDCSGFTRYAVYRATGGKIDLPHLASDQAQAGHSVPPDAAHMQPGDLVLFALGDRLGPGRISHVGIYMGGGKMLNAGGDNATGSVRVNDLTTGYWQGKKPWTVRRLSLGSKL